MQVTAYKFKFVLGLKKIVFGHILIESIKPIEKSFYAKTDI